MKDLLHLGLLVAGVSQILLCLGSVAIPKILGWQEKLQVLSPLMRQLWWTYALYILASHFFFALLSLVAADWLLSETLPAAMVSGFVMIWWGIRLVLQFGGFDFEELPGNLFDRVAKGILSVLFVCLFLVYAATFLWNLGVFGKGGGL